jgi:putative hemolysin
MFANQLAKLAPLGQVIITIDGNEASPVYYIPPISAGTPSFGTVNSLYVYCDVVGYQRVADSSAQLMGIAPVQGIPWQRTHYVFDPPTY